MADPIARSLPGLRKRLGKTLPDTAYNERTLETHPCRVDEGTGQERLSGLPTYLAPPKWDITLPDFVVMQAGDVLRVTRLEDGSVTRYGTMHVIDRDSYSVSTDCTAIRLALSAFGSLPIPPNAVGANAVKFTRPSHPSLPAITADAFVHDMTDPAHMDFGGTAQLLWTAIVGSDIAFTDGTPLRANDLITCPLALGKNEQGDSITAPILQPMPVFGSVNYVTVYFFVNP